MDKAQSSSSILTSSYGRGARTDFVNLKMYCHADRISLDGPAMKLVFRACMIALVLGALSSAPASACCCTCENSARCFPTCNVAADAQECADACGGNGCGAA